MATKTSVNPGWLIKEMNEETDDPEEDPFAISAAQPDVRVPIVGYEIMEQRPRFTVYKIHVHKGPRRWFVFRRYTDFIRLNERLEECYPTFNVQLPGRRWFKSNFDHDFIEERARGLQYFINTIMGHEELSGSCPVREFFCLDDPPGPFDSLEQARAYCQSLESQVADLSDNIKILETELSATKSQLKQARAQQKSVVAALQAERALNSLSEDDVEIILSHKRRHSCGSRFQTGKSTQQTRKQDFRTFDQYYNNVTIEKTMDSGRDSGFAFNVSDTRSDDENLQECVLEGAGGVGAYGANWDGSVEITSHSDTQGVDQLKEGKKIFSDHAVVEGHKQRSNDYNGDVHKSTDFDQEVITDDDKNVDNYELENENIFSDQKGEERGGFTNLVVAMEEDQNNDNSDNENENRYLDQEGEAKGEIYDHLQTSYDANTDRFATENENGFHDQEGERKEVVADLTVKKTNTNKKKEEEKGLTYHSLEKDIDVKENCEGTENDCLDKCTSDVEKSDMTEECDKDAGLSVNDSEKGSEYCAANSYSVEGDHVDKPVITLETAKITIQTVN